MFLCKNQLQTFVPCFVEFNENLTAENIGVILPGNSAKKHSVKPKTLQQSADAMPLVFVLNCIICLERHYFQTGKYVKAFHKRHKGILAEEKSMCPRCVYFAD